MAYSCNSFPPWGSQLQAVAVACVATGCISWLTAAVAIIHRGCSCKPWLLLCVQACAFATWNRHARRVRNYQGEPLAYSCMGDPRCSCKHADTCSARNCEERQRWAEAAMQVG